MQSYFQTTLSGWRRYMLLRLNFNNNNIMMIMLMKIFIIVKPNRQRWQRCRRRWRRRRRITQKNCHKLLKNEMKWRARQQGRRMECRWRMVTVESKSEWSDADKNWTRKIWWSRSILARHLVFFHYFLLVVLSIESRMFEICCEWYRFMVRWHWLCTWSDALHCWINFCWQRLLQILIDKVYGWI